MDICRGYFCLLLGLRSFHILRYQCRSRGQKPPHSLDSHARVCVLLSWSRSLKAPDAPKLPISQHVKNYAKNALQAGK
eukprot:5560975-Pyramimonas_sp.AAC.1